MSLWDGLPVSHPERIAVNLQKIFRDDIFLGACLGDWYLLPDPLKIPDKPLPFGMLAVSSERHVVEPSVNLTQVGVVSTIVWEEDRDAIEAEEATVGRAVSRMQELIMVDFRGLAVPGSFGGQSLVDTPRTFETIAYDATVRGGDLDHSAGAVDPEDDLPEYSPLTLLRFLDVLIVFEYVFDRATWTKTGFTP